MNEHKIYVHNCINWEHGGSDAWSDNREATQIEIADAVEMRNKLNAMYKHIEILKAEVQSYRDTCKHEIFYDETVSYMYNRACVKCGYSVMF